MDAIINQFFGLGDIIFEQTAIHSMGYDNIIWPVEPQFVDGLNRAYPDISFVNKNSFNIDYERKDNYIIHDSVVIPMRFADSICKVPYWQCMQSKYVLLNQDWHSWKEKAMWERDKDREQLLFNMLRGHSCYNLINKTFGSNNAGRVDINVDNGLPNIYMHEHDGFSLFDWALIIENAANIYTVSTSIIYLLELLNLKAKEIKIYLRKPYEQDHRNYDYILTSHKYVLE